ncbi:2-octaprenyl-6-methoxyphenyl hydroxylase [Magnetovirga frankeli]|uniref:2-octaprenyl-6-methoxyphenyl hydroxylase n=1 Tax=Magnetovirga frankeli TaxID=947516 RepID=UPI001293C957|nr:2-octaprenyl-6-methoxyphenyl hydroxylase [gamma proteobacterium SS-5]
MHTDPIDIAIVGGGMNGASLALALSQAGLSTALIEAVSLQSEQRPSYDDRAIALALGSVRILQRLGIWTELAPLAEPIHRIHVSDRGHFGIARLDSAAQRVPFLGQVALARDIGAALNRRLSQAPNLRLLCPARLRGFTQEADQVRLRIDQQGQQLGLGAKLLVAADGADSPIRRQLDIPTRHWRYGQHALVANLTPGRPHQGQAFERFTDSGPLALLPMPGNRCGLVWTCWDAQRDELLGLDDAAFLARLQQRFGQRLGRLHSLGQRAAYPLRLMQVRQHYRQRVVLLGNAAHALHPIAGQGFNLGLRDCAVLAEILSSGRSQGIDPGSPTLLDRYARQRDTDQQATGLFTDLLARLFTSPLPPLKLGRNLGLLALDLLPPLKQALARRAMGFR